jgi:membrane protease YdiL (CAAX protease family)
LFGWSLDEWVAREKRLEPLKGVWYKWSRIMDSRHKDGLKWALTACILAIIISPLVTILSGSPNFSALVLLPLAVFFWLAVRPGRVDLGISPGRPRHYGLAVAYPLIVMGLLLMLIWRLEGISWAGMDGRRIAFVIAVNSLAGTLGVLLTEEGFFRGVVWGLLGTRDVDGRRILIFTSVAFLIWHVPVAFLEMGEGFPRSAIPVYLVNVLLLGLNWGLLRLASGSVIVPALSHAVWNAIAYKFFGFGVEYGELARSSFTVLDPERGVAGIGLNAAFALILWMLVAAGARRKRGPSA